MNPIRFLLCIAIVASVFSASGTIYAQNYAGRIYPGVRIGPVDVGGMTHEEAATVLSSVTNEILESGLTISTKGRSARIPFTSQAINDPDATNSLVSWDIDSAVREATLVGRNSFLLIDMIAPIFVRISTPTIMIAPTIDRDRLEASIRATFSEYDEPPVDAGFAIRKTSYGFDVQVTPDLDGTIMETGKLIGELQKMLTTELTILPLELQIEERSATISAEEAQTLVTKVQEALNATPYTLSYTPQSQTQPVEWKVSADELINGLIVWEPPQTPTLMLGISDEFTANIFDQIATEVNQPAQDARFAVQNGRVAEFQGNENGIELDVVETRGKLVEQFGNTNATIDLIVDVIEPTVSIGSINDLGIREVIGVGTSNFSGSPTNRIRNIKNGATLLNGILIAPDQTFSLLEALRPFTTENGYLPELVIKGDRIIPEIGGGLCQIGTTTFRAAMSAGLPIVERQNHSLAVSYYNDPQNGNPGTDATIYDPSPDFKFLNDTGNYILFATEMDESTGALIFTLWGTSDGRKGSYSAPEVSSWIGTGPTRIVETTDLAPGVRQCQHGFVGANASFTYTVIQADGTVNEQIFTSSYRALPEICMVGVEKSIEEESVEDVEGLQSD
ncbi:MAG: VanW family protein [Patescibacteria group bacterium]